MTVLLALLLIPFVPISAESSPGSEAPGKRSISVPDLDRTLGKLRGKHGLSEDGKAIVVDVSEQRLYLVQGNRPVGSCPVSTSKYGVGNKNGSNKTPLGTHRVKKKYGAGAEKGAVFIARANTGRIARIYTEPKDLDEDLVTTRILWLEGLEKGLNKGKGVDSYSRYIYIHGTPEEGLIGTPASHGCVRMKNDDVIELFNRVEEGTLVEIRE